MSASKLIIGLILGVCTLSAGSPGFAHHAFAAEFDANNCRDFNGVLTAIDWQNPHAFFYVDVEEADGEIQNWSFQTYALITLKRAGTGLQYFKENIGKQVYVRGCLARNGSQHYASAGLMRAEDGIMRQMGQIQN